MDIMDKTVKSITCDSCEKQMIKSTKNPHEFGLVLSCQDFNINKSGMQYSVLQYPIIKRDHHFCGLDCLKTWIEKGAKKND